MFRDVRGTGQEDSPRSGSTLLASILRQNPNLHAMMPTSTLIGSRRSLLNQHEHAVFIEEEHRQDVLRRLLDSHYRESTQKAANAAMRLHYRPHILQRLN